MSAQMHSWEPGQAKTAITEVTSPAEVQKMADDLTARHGKSDYLPGLELTNDQGESLSIAASSDAWALVHTDAQFAQHCTKRAGDDTGRSRDVQWEEVTSIPEQWFIPKALALTGVKQWLDNGTLSSELPWSDQAF